MRYKKSAVETHNSRKEKRENKAMLGLIIVVIFLAYLFFKSTEKNENNGKVKPKKETNYDPDE